MRCDRVAKEEEVLDQLVDVGVEAWNYTYRVQIAPHKSPNLRYETWEERVAEESVRVCLDLLVLFTFDSLSKKQKAKSRKILHASLF